MSKLQRSSESAELKEMGRQALVMAASICGQMVLQIPNPQLRMNTHIMALLIDTVNIRGCDEKQCMQDIEVYTAMMKGNLPNILADYAQFEKHMEGATEQ